MLGGGGAGMKLSTLAFGPKKARKTVHEPPAERRNLFTVSMLAVICLVAAFLQIGRPKAKKGLVEGFKPVPRHTYCDGAGATR